MYNLNAKEIIILSGEGERGTPEVYTGKRTTRALKSRLTKERCQGDRWAKAIAFLYYGRYNQPVGINVENGDPATYPDCAESKFQYIGE